MEKQEEYRLFLDYVLKMIERRGTVTTTYLSVNAAIAGAIALLFKDIQPDLWGQQLATVVLLFAGIIACALWRKLIFQYSTLLGWWYRKLRDLETELPISTKLLTEENLDLYQAGSKKPTIGLTRYEMQLSWLFTAMYLLFCIVIIAFFLNFGLKNLVSS